MTFPLQAFYKRVHAGQHVSPHYVTAVFGDTFPPCVDCSDNVRFELALSAVHVKAHPQFKRQLIRPRRSVVIQP
jgi:hypothetical protein